MPERAIVEVLPQEYYLDNFCFLIDFVERHYRPVLTAAELAWRLRFHNLSPDARKLYVRMLLRRGPVFRRDKLSYDEIIDCDAAAVELLETRMACANSELAMEAQLGVLTVAELRQLPEATELTGQLRRDALLDALVERVAAVPYDLISPFGHEHLQIYKLLFFGNLHQDFTDFVLGEMGLAPCESYAIDPSANWLSSRAMIDEFCQLQVLSELSRLAVEARSVEAMQAVITTLPRRHEHPRLASRFDRIVNRVARQLEREEELAVAFETYALAEDAPARERRARILATMEQFEDSRAICASILAAPQSDQEHEFALRFLKKLRRKCEGEVIDEQRLAWLDYKPEVRHAEVPFTGERVERATIDWFNEGEHTACYVENSLFGSLFGLLLWDIIFAPARDAFFNPYQHGPADMYLPEFRDKRHEALERRFRALHSREVMLALFQRHFEDKYGLANHFVSWQWLDPAVVERFIAVTEPSKIVLVLRRMLADPRANRAGFPDLVVFGEEGCELVEVKGPGDKLQDNQKRWLRFFDGIGLPAVVLHVTYQEDIAAS